jgi:hypothetical protein
MTSAEQSVPFRPTANDGNWQPIVTMPEDVACWTKIDGNEHGARNIQTLVKRTREPGKTKPIYWYPDGSMYVYYVPTHWQPVP